MVDLYSFHRVVWWSDISYVTYVQEPEPKTLRSVMSVRYECTPEINLLHNLFLYNLRFYFCYEFLTVCLKRNFIIFSFYTFRKNVKFKESILVGFRFLKKWLKLGVREVFGVTKIDSFKNCQ